MDENQKPNFETSVDTLIISKQFASMEKDQFIAYDDLNSLVKGRDLQWHDRHILDSARRLVLKEHNIVIGCVHGKGVKRLTDSEIVELPQVLTHHVRRMCYKTLKKGACAVLNGSNPSEKVKYALGMSVIGTIYQFTKPKHLKMIEDKVAMEPKKLTFRETLVMFK